MVTSQIAEPISGDKLYQIRARECLPLLVRQAEAGNTITYGELAEELKMPNARNLNYVLGSIGQTLENLSKAKKQKIPPIQALVVNKSTGLPGEGVGWFLVKREDYVALPPERKLAIVQADLKNIFAYPYWLAVLDELKLPKAPSVISVKSEHYLTGSGEGPEHKSLKDFVARNPEMVGGIEIGVSGQTEVALLSGDYLDVSFRGKASWVAIEVKSKTSSVADIQRGLFQCIEYRAVMRAETVAKGAYLDVRVVLVLGGSLPAELRAVKNVLRVEVIENVAGASLNMRSS